MSSYTMSNSTVLQLCNRSHLHTPVCRGQVPIGRATWPHRHELSDCTRRGAHSLVAPSARQRSEPRQPRRRGTRRRSLQGSNCRLQDCRLASELPLKNRRSIEIFWDMHAIGILGNLRYPSEYCEQSSCRVARPDHVRNREPFPSPCKRARFHDFEQAPLSYNEGRLQACN